MRRGRGGAGAGVLAVLLGVLTTPAWAQRPEARRTPQPDASRQSAARAPAREAVPRPWEDDYEAAGPADALDARRDAILRWHEQRRAWLQARRDGWPAAPDGWADGEDMADERLAPARVDAMGRRSGATYDRRRGFSGADSWRGARDFGRRPSAFCLSFGLGDVFRGFGDDGWGRSWARRCGHSRRAPLPYPGAIPPGYLPYPSLDPYAYPYPNPAVYPVPHRFERRFHPEEPSSREAPDYPADPYAYGYAPGAYGYWGAYGYADPFGGGGYGYPFMGGVDGYGVWADGYGGLPGRGTFTRHGQAHGRVYGQGSGRRYGNGDLGDCVVVTGATSAGSYFEVVLDPGSLGARSGGEVLAGIEGRLRQGTAVVLRGVDGVEVRLAPGARAVRLGAERCGG